MQLEKATELVSKLWFPFNNSILSSVKSKLQLSDFQTSRDAVVGELEKDLSLFLLCLKELVAILNSKGTIMSGKEMSAHEFFSHVTKQEFELALTKVSKFRSHQGVDTASKFQKYKLVEMYISGVAVKTLSENLINRGKVAISRELSYSSVLLRQLGATLIAWNYPQIYEKVVLDRHSPDSFDEALRKSLGFTPMMLGLSVAKSWNLPPVYLRIIGGDHACCVSDTAYQLTDNEKAISDSVVQICEVGEALARAMNPELFSSSVLDLDKASKFIQKVIGEHGIREILNSTKDQLRHIKLESLEYIIDESTNLLVEKVSSTKFSCELLCRNVYLDAVPKELYEIVSALYYMMTPDGSLRSYAEIFAKKVVPATIFSSMTVYLFDPFKQILYPSLIIGNPKVLAPKIVPMSGVPSAYNIISAGFSLRNPLREDRIVGNNEDLVMLAGSIGGDPAIGVMYAEVDPNIPDFPDNIMRYFKAIKLLLCDSLRLQISEES